MLPKPSYNNRVFTRISNLKFWSDRKYRDHNSCNKISSWSLDTYLLETKMNVWKHM